MGFKHANYLPEGAEVIVNSERAAKLATVGPFTVEKYLGNGEVRITDGVGESHTVSEADLQGLVDAPE